MSHPLLTAPIGSSLWRLAAPTTAVMMVQTVVAIAETWFFGRLGTDALAGFALVFPFMMLMQMMAAGGQGHLAARALPDMHQGIGVAHEMSPRCCQARAGLVAHEQPASQLVFQGAHAGADRRLGQVQPLGGGMEAARIGNSEESARLVDIHAFNTKFLLKNNNNIRLSHRSRNDSISSLFFLKNINISVQYVECPTLAP